MTNKIKYSSEAARNLGNYLATNYSKSPIEFKNGLKILERNLIKNVPIQKYQTEIKRRCAEMYFSYCLENNTDWKITKSALKKLESLGYTNIERRGHFAILLNIYAKNTSKAKKTAKSRAIEALRRVKCMKKSNLLRQNYEANLLKYA